MGGGEAGLPGANGRANPLTDNSVGLVPDGLFELSKEDKRRTITQSWQLLAQSAAEAKSGAYDQANATLDYGFGLLAKVPKAKITMAPRYYAQKASVALDQGNTGYALRLGKLALEAIQAVDSGSAIAARIEFIYATALARNNQSAEAFLHFENGISLYEQNPVPLQFERGWPFFAFALGQIEADPSAASEWQNRMFRAAQLVRSSSSVKAIAKAAQVFAAEAGKGDAAVQAWKEADNQVALAKGRLVLARQNHLVLPEQVRQFEDILASADEEERLARTRRDAEAPGFRRALETPVSLSQVQHQLKKGEALIQILVGKPRSLVFLIRPDDGPDSVIVRSIDAHVTVINTIVGGMRGVLQADVIGRDQLAIPQFPADLSYAVYNLLFGDVASVIEQQDRLFVVSTGQLQSLPVEALVISDPGTGEGTWLAPSFDFSKVR